jgi:pimeloyl-ACP methyl ester carboxylesterase
MHELATAGGFKLFIGKAIGYLQENIAVELLAAAEHADTVFRFDADRVLDAFHGKQARRATQAIMRQTIPFDAQGRPDWSRIERLVADYRNVDLPVLLLWGQRDETLSLAMGYKLFAELPDVRLRVLREGKHSLQSDRPADVAGWIDRFLEDAGAGWARLEYLD